MLRSFASASVRSARAVRFNSTQASQQAVYVVERTANGTLPVYSDVKGNAVRTIIRRVRGSAEVSVNHCQGLRRNTLGKSVIISSAIASRRYRGLGRRFRGDARCTSPTAIGALSDCIDLVSRRKRSCGSRAEPE